MARKITSGRGTCVLKMDAAESFWTGEPFIKYQKERLESLSEKKVLTLGKGTGRILAAEYPKKLQRSSHSGRFIVIQRGTKLYRLP